MLKIKNDTSVVRLFLSSLLFITIISTAIMGYLWINHENKRFDEDCVKLRKEYMESQKVMIKNETEKVIDYIQYTRSKANQRLKQLLKERVYEAHSIASNIYRKYRHMKNKGAIKQFIKDALRPIRFSKGRGYFYIYTLDGVLELYPSKPEIESRNQLNLQDKHGVYVVKRELELVKKEGEGFIVSVWANPSGKREIISSKVSFVKYFKPFNWYIGSKEYREDFTHDIQQELLDRIGKITFGVDGYIFVVDYDGVTLWNEARGDLIGRNVWAADTGKGEDTIREARKAAENPDGGFIQYSWFRLKSAAPVPKISYVKGVQDWQWIVGAGIYLDEIERVIAGRRVALKKNVRNQVIKIIGLFLLIIAVVFMITVYFSKRLRKEFDVFASFFRESAVNNEKMDKNKLAAEEFKILADSVNRMVEERQKIENSFRESEERLAVTFRSIGEGVIATDIEGKVVLINRAAEGLTGWDREKARGRFLEEIFRLMDEKTKEPVQNPVEPAIKTGDLVQLKGPATLVAGDGTNRLISSSAAPLRDKESKIIGAVMVFQDVTEKQKMEEDLQKAHKLESVGLLAGGIAHDFNNLLTGILGNINLAKSHVNSGDEIFKPLLQAEKATIKTKQLTQQLLTFSSGGAPIKKVHDISELIKESATFSLRGSNVKPEFQIPEDLWAVEADEGQMNQMLNNLVINAAQAMPAGGVVRIAAANVPPGKNSGLPLPLTDSKYVQIAVEDSGSGIPEELLPKIFDPYFTTKPKGSGLGLTSAYSIASKHDGYIDVKSRPGEGATFTVYIPASDKEAPVGEKDRNDEIIIKGSGKVLVMDDDKIVGDVVMRLLDSLGYQSTLVGDGMRAIEEYRKAFDSGSPYDMVLMDLTIPGGLGGAETIKQLLEIDPEVKAIVSSGYSNDPIMADFRAHGFKACIVKPYRMQELSQTLHKVTNSTV